MLIQEQLPWTQMDDEHLSLFKAIGVDYVTINPPPDDLKDGVDRADFWKEMSRRVDSNGMKLDNVGMNCWDEISLALPDRDQKIDAWCTMIRNPRCRRDPHFGLQLQTHRKFPYNLSDWTW